jgi:hypothetical protein
MKTVLIFLTVIALFTGCSRSSYSPEIESVLRQAGENRSQLEKVLQRYSRNSADSLKLRSAEFLIANMADKYSIEYNVPFENLIAYCMHMGGVESHEAVEKAYGSLAPVKKEDVKYITGDYLINNIELAFKVWEEQPWGRDIPFDVFCEEILPYREANEPLENWREKVLASFAVQSSSFKTQPGITIVDACTLINSHLPLFRFSPGIPDVNYSMLMTVRAGACEEMTLLAVFAMRALGIPVSKDCTLKWPNMEIGHSWNSGYAGENRRFSFMGAEKNPEQDHIYRYTSRSKIYRQTFARQERIKNDADIPPALRDQYHYLKDVTREYCTSDSLFRCDKFCEVEIPVKYQPFRHTGYVWLASKGVYGWHTVGWGESDTKTVNFGMTGKNILYLPLYYADNVQTPANYPFTVDSNDSVHFFKPDTGNYLQLTLTELSPPSYDYKKRMNNGVFEGANRSDFSDAKVLHVIKELDGIYFHSTEIRNPTQYRYIRYVSPSNGHCNVAEIVFYNNKGEKLDGKPIGSSVPLFTPDASYDKAFDGDILTFYDTEPRNGGWTGLDLGEPQTVAKISYFPRNEGNFIYEGHTYELFYWENDWQVYERQVATSHFLNLRIPANGLYYFKSVTTGKTYPWFTLNEKGRQQF